MDREAERHREMEPQPEDFLMLGLDLQNKCDRRGTWASAERNFREFFGASSVVVAVLWRMLSEYDMVPEGGKIVHILWTLHFFCAYPKEGHACAIAGGSGGAVDPKTHRKFVWAFIYAIANAESIVVSSCPLTGVFISRNSHILMLYLQILFENRKMSGSLNNCLVSVDGTDLRIPQQGPAQKGNPFSSHKYKGKSALRYELAVDIKTGYLVWINGPFPAGAFPDVEIFRSCLVEELDEDERVEADDGYIGEAPHKVKCPGSVSNPLENEHMQACTRMR